jgi:hypothetical protein
MAQTLDVSPNRQDGAPVDGGPFRGWVRILTAQDLGWLQNTSTNPTRLLFGDPDAEGAAAHRLAHGQSIDTSMFKADVYAEPNARGLSFSDYA